MINIIHYKNKHKKQLIKSIHYFYSIHSSIQSYFPYISFFSNYKLNSSRLNHKYELIRLLNKRYKCNIHGNVFTGLIYSNKNYHKKLVFVKEIPIIPHLWINLFRNKNNSTEDNIMSNPYYYNYSKFLHSIYNSCYIDVFCTYLCSKLVENHISPHFPYFYGTMQCNFKKFSYEIESSEMELFRKNNTFLSNNQSKMYKQQTHYILEQKKIPVQLLFTENIKNVFNIFLEKKNTCAEWFSVLFQIVVSVYTIQKKYSMCHNDLHIGNIMYSHTDDKYIYYKIDDKIYRVRTYNKIIKIIDFGRSTLHYNNYTIHNTVYEFNNEAHTLMNYMHPTKPTIPSYHFDIAVFVSSLLIHKEMYNIPNKIIHMLHQWIDPFPIHTYQSLTFELYRKIVRNKLNCTPKQLIDHYFNIYIYKPFNKISKLYTI